MSAALPATPGAEPPPTAKQPVTDTYHGVTVTDDYRWLEEAGTPAVTAWTTAQNRHTRNALDALPERPAIEARLTKLFAKIGRAHV